MKSSGQAAVEFMICILVLVFAMIVFSVYAGSKDFERSNTEAKLEADKLCWQISHLINIAMYSRGYYSEFSLPMKINGLDYNVSVSNNTVVVDYERHSCIYQIAVTDISFRTKKAPFSLCGGDFYINNTNNELFIYNRSVVKC